MDREPNSDKHGAGIPIVGRLTIWELLGFVGLILAATFGALGLWSLWPLLEDISAPGSGGGAQMLLAMFVFPALFMCGSLIVSSAIGFGLLLRGVKARLDGRNVRSLTPAMTLNPRAIAQPMQVLTASFVVQVSGMVVPLLFSKAPSQLDAAIGLVVVLAGIVFLIYLGVLAARLGKSWALWVFLTVITPPFGPFVAYFLMRKAVKDAIGNDTSAT